MAVTVTLHIEVKINGNWEHYTYPDVQQHPLLLDVLGRESPQARTAPIEFIHKGLPANITRLTRFNHEKQHKDAFGESWLDSRSIALIEQRFAEIDPAGSSMRPLESSVYRAWLFGNTFGYVARFGGDEIAPGLEDVRFVYWFRP
jgi:hypothetical protein